MIEKPERSRATKRGTSDPAPQVLNPAMIRLARGAFPLTQEELADRLSVPQAKISRWEDGISPPAEADVERIAHILQYPVEFFFQHDAVYGFGTCCLYHRKRKSLSVKTLNSIHDRINVLRMGVSRLLRNIHDIETKFESFDISEHESPEAVARMVRALWQMPFGPVRNLVATVEAAGAVIVPCSFGTDQLDAVSQWPPGLPPLIFVNANRSTDRLRYTLAHEVGHLFMHRIPSANAEAEADRFASELLMPAREIAIELDSLSLEKAFQLKPRWRVSAQALIRRARDVGAITDRRYTSLYAFLSSKGYRKNEPVPLESERPMTLRRLVDVHANALGYPMQQISRLTFCLELDQFKRRFLLDESPSGLRVIG